MPLTPEDVSNKRFTTVRLREGYDMTEVDQFLDEVEAELARLTKENDDLREQVSQLEQRLGRTLFRKQGRGLVLSPEEEFAMTRGEHGRPQREGYGSTRVSDIDAETTVRETPAP